MIIKIEKPNKQIAKTLEYNENKATGEEGIHLQNQINEDIASKEKGHIVVTRNVPEQSSLENEFARLQMLNFKTIRGRKLSNVAFHMSVNPSEDDRKLSEKEMVGYIDELMERLGYKDCPYRIYKHTDIEREHYHVVAIRIGQDGKKIKDNFENLRANKIGIELEEKYGYKIGKQAKEERETKKAESRSRTDAKNEESKNDETAVSTDSQKDKPAYIPRFNMKSAIPKINQVKDIHNEAMKWSFTTMEQYQALLKWRFSLMAEQYDNGMLYCGLEDKGKKSNTKPLNEKELGLECLDQIMERIQETDMKHP